MNIRTLAITVLAALGLAAACEQKPEDFGPAAISADKNELTFTSEAASQTVSITASREWYVSTDADWVICTPDKGDPKKDAQLIEVSVLQNTEYDRSATLVFSIGLAEQKITVSQPGQKGERKALTVSEFNATEADEKTIYEVAGTVTGSINTQYGNFYLTDGKEQMQVYGTVNWSEYSDKLSAGDIVTVRGPHVLFKTTHEIKDATIIAWEKGPGVTPPSGPENAVYYNNFDKTAAEKTYGTGSSWPYLDQSDCWENGSGSGAAGVSYIYKAMSARNNSNSDGSYSDYAGSGVNNLFFGSNAYFAVKDIALGGKKDLTLSFGTEKYLQGGSVFANSEFHVYVSADAQKWVEIEYSFPNGVKDGRWDVASSVFTVPSGTEKLSIYFSADVASAYRLDDLILVPSDKAGTAVDFSKGVALEGGSDDPVTPPAGGDEKMTIAQLIAAADGTTATVENVYVGAVTTKGYIATDGTSHVYVYTNSDPKVAVGDKVNFTGKKTTYFELPEVTEPSTTKVSSGNTVPYPTAKDITATFDSYSSSVAEYVTYTATVYKDGSYTNFKVEGASARVGALSSAPSSVYNALAEGDKVQVSGYFNTVNASKTPNLLNVVAVSVKKEGSSDDPVTPPTPPAGEASEYASTVVWALGANAYDQDAVINGAAVPHVLKLGTSSKVGAATVTLPKGTKKFSFYGISWKGKQATVVVKLGETEILSQDLAANDGATGNPTYTITVSGSDKYSKTLDAPLAADTDVTVTTTGTNTRVILFGIKAE